MPVLSYNLFSLQGFVIVDVGFFNAVSCQHLKIRISGCLATPFLISRWHQQAVAERGGVLLGGVVAPWFIITLTHPSTQ